MEFKHELGSKVRSIVTGIEGTLTSRSENMYGCNRYFIQPRVGADGKLPDGWWVDEADVEVVEAPKTARVEKNVGGPMSRNA